VDGSNSFDKFLESFKNNGVLKKGISQDFLQGLSLYIDDMRILKNICNEFLIYNNSISTTEQDPNKMLALIAYKNIFPQDFSDLQFGKGFMFEIIGGKGKKRLIELENNELEEKIKLNEDKIKRVQTEGLNEDELSLFYAKKIQIPHWYALSPAERKKQLLSLENNNQYKRIINEYKERISYIKENCIANLENEIANFESAKNALNGRRISELITRENIDDFFKDTVFISETGQKEPFNIIKDSPYFDMIKYLVREGYINETYSDYMTYFYENSLICNDKIFLRSVTDKKAKEWNYKLDNPELVVSLLSLSDFDQEETLNYSLFNWLLSDYVGKKNYKEKALRFILQIKERQKLSFILEYSETTNNISNMIYVFGKEWQDFIAELFFKYGINKPSNTFRLEDKFLQKYAYTLFLLCTLKDNILNSGYLEYLNEESRKKLVEYVSNDVYFLSQDFFSFEQTIQKIAQLEEMTEKAALVRMEMAKVHAKSQKAISNIATGIKLFGILFTKINAKIANKQLLEQVYKNDSYVINFDNIVTMLTTFYKEIDITLVNSQNYTLIMSDKESPLAEYVNRNIDDYMDVVLKNCNNKISDSHEMVISILNNPDINITKKEKYIEYLYTEILNLTDIEDTSLWGNLLQNAKSVRMFNEILKFLRKNYKDFLFITENYEELDEDSKEEILSIAIDRISKIVANPENINRKLLTDLLESDKVDSDDKSEIFSFLFPDAKDEEKECWLTLGYVEFLKLYQKNRPTKYDNTSKNEKTSENVQNTTLS
jgi:hypothetical protein